MNNVQLLLKSASINDLLSKQIVHNSQKKQIFSKKQDKIYS